MTHFERLDATFDCGGESDSYECAVCRSECDRYDEKPIRLDGEDVCPACRELCDGNCGEYLTDETIASCGPVVHFRDWVVRGQLRHSHASCAADTLLTYMDPAFDYDHSTREEIASAVELHTAQAVVLEHFENAQCIPAADGWFQIVKQIPVYWKGDIIEDGRSEREAWIDASVAVRAVPA